MKSKGDKKAVPSSEGGPNNHAEELQRFLDRIPSMLGYWNRDLTNKISNEAYASYFGKHPADIRGLSMKKLLGPALFQMNLPHIRAALKGKPQTFERTIPTPDGVQRETIANYIPDLQDGKVLGFFVVVTDVGALKKLERSNREIEAKLVASSKMSSLGEMASGIAHEINNPLSILYGGACQAAKLLHKKDFNIAKISRLIAEIQETALRIESIVDGLRTFSGDPSNQAVEMVSAASIVKQTLTFCKARFDRYGVKLTIKNLDPSIFLECRSIQISQILLNLLNNAFDVVRDSATKKISIDLKKDGKFVRFIVSNSGPKIPPEIADKIFQPFFTTKAGGKGVGLGLSISKGIAESHKGSLLLDSKAKETRFVVRLPVRQ